jgi:hypothetical protein
MLPVSLPEETVLTRGDILRRRNRPLLNVFKAFKSDGHSIGAIFARLSA